MFPLSQRAVEAPDITMGGVGGQCQLMVLTTLMDVDVVLGMTSLVSLMSR